MPSTLLEIIELSNGDIVLRRADEDGEPLVNIHFSKECRHYIGENQLDIAKVMLQAGIQAAAQMEERLALETEDETVEHTLH